MPGRKPERTSVVSGQACLLRDDNRGASNRRGGGHVGFLRVGTSSATKDIATGAKITQDTPLADTGMATTSQSHTAAEDVGNLGSSWTAGRKAAAAALKAAWSSPGDSSPWYVPKRSENMWPQRICTQAFTEPCFLSAKKCKPTCPTNEEQTDMRQRTYTVEPQPQKGPMQAPCGRAQRRRHTDSPGAAQEAV